MRKAASILAIVALVGVVALYGLFRSQRTKTADELRRLKERIATVEQGLAEKQVAYRTVEIFFTKDAERVVAVERKLPKGDPEQMLEAAFKELLAGPTAQEQNRGLSNQLPADAKLLDVEVKDDLAYLDFSRELAQVGGSARVRGILKQIGYTATAVPEIRGAWLLIEGKKVEVFSGEGAIIEKPLARSEGPEL